MTELSLLSAFASDPPVDAPRAFYRWIVGDLRTGKISRTIDLTDTRWSTDIADDGTLDASFPLRSRRPDGTLEWPTAYSDTAAAKSFLAVAYVNAAGDETFQAAGPIWKSRFDDATGVLSVGASALSSYFDHRKVIPVLAPGQNPATASVTYDTAELSLIAKRLVELSQSHTGGALPIVLPDDADLGGAGDAHTRTYPGYELGWVGERLKQLSEVIGGPEYQFVPRRRTDDPRFIEWVMRIGVQPTMLLTQDGPPWVFDRTVPTSPVASISVETDGTDQTFRSWAAGQGEAEGRPIAYVEDDTLIDLGWPLLESEVTATDSVSRLETLIGHASDDIAANARPIETWTVIVNRDARPNVAQYQAGDWCVVRVRDHIYLPDGDFPMRIVSKAGDASPFVTLQMAPQPAEAA